MRDTEKSAENQNQQKPPSCSVSCSSPRTAHGPWPSARACLGLSPQGKGPGSAGRDFQTPCAQTLHSTGHRDVRARTCLVPDATMVLAHSVFSMLRLSWTGGSQSSCSQREGENSKLATFFTSDTCSDRNKCTSWIQRVSREAALQNIGE